jgi:pimeloyl-ACP methyl ester carboxylesterase
MIAAAALLAPPIFLATDAVMGATSIPLERPDFHYVPGKLGKRLVYVVFDGFIGHPEKRFANAMEVFGGHSVLFVNPAGDRFNLEFEAHNTITKINDLDIRKVILVGGSLGAKKAYRTAQLLPPSVGFDSLKLIDPLHDGSGVKNPAATAIYYTAWHPGPMQNWLLSRGNLAGKMVTNLWHGPDPENEHQQYGFRVKASRIADEARESRRGPIKGILPEPVPVTIIRCLPEEDEILKTAQTTAWVERLRDRGHSVQVITADAGTHHMGIDTEWWLWVRALSEGLAPAA